MVELSFSKDELVLRLEGAQKPLALKGTVRIPLRCIQAVSTSPPKFPLLRPRVGTRVPWGLVAGTFWTKTGKEFYYARDREACVTLNLRDHEYSKVVFEVGDKARVADDLRRASSL